MLRNGESLVIVLRIECCHPLPSDMFPRFTYECGYVRSISKDGILSYKGSISLDTEQQKHYVLIEPSKIQETCKALGIKLVKDKKVKTI